MAKMKFLFAILWLSYILHLSCSCPPKKKERQQRVFYGFLGDDGYYSEGTHKTDPKCMNIRSKQSKETSDRTSPVCEDMLPGLSHVERGAIKDFFYTSYEELSQQHFAKIFDFSCKASFDNKIRKFQYYNIPSEVLGVEPTTQKIQRDKKIVSLEGLRNNVEKNLQLTAAINDYIIKMSLLNKAWVCRIYEENLYFGETVNVYDVQLRDDVRPNEQVLAEYKKLPRHWSLDVEAYFNFIMKFGTHYRHTTTLGGSFVLLIYLKTYKKISKEQINIDNNVTIENFINKVAKIENKKDSILTTFGGSHYNQNLHNWETSVIEEPIPLNSAFLPLPQILDHPTSKRAVSLSEFISFEMVHQRYKRFKFELDLPNSINGIVRFVSQQIEKQLQYVCPSQYLDSILDDIEKHDNMLFEKFHVICHTKRVVYDGNKNNDVYYNKVIYLAPLVCFTFNKPLPQCRPAQFTFPKDVKCVQLFLSSHCNGQPIKVSDPNEMGEIFENDKIMSLSLCNAD